MPKNQVSVEELRCRVMKLKNSAYFDTIPIAEGSDKTRHLYPGRAVGSEAPQLRTGNASRIPLLGGLDRYGKPKYYT